MDCLPLTKNSSQIHCLHIVCQSKISTNEWTPLSYVTGPYHATSRGMSQRPIEWASVFKEHARSKQFSNEEFLLFYSVNLEQLLPIFKPSLKSLIKQITGYVWMDDDQILQMSILLRIYRKEITGPCAGWVLELKECSIIVVLGIFCFLLS